MNKKEHVNIKGDEINKFYDMYFYGVIYLITNKVNNKIYIGKTSNKIITYLNRLFWYIPKNSKRPIIRAIRKYGIENFECKVIDCFRTKKELNEAEINYIEKYNSRNPKIGYNIAPGGEGGIGGPNFKDHKHSEETKQKMRNVDPLKRANNKGRIFSEEWRKNIGKASSKRMKGQPKSDEHRQNISKARKGIPPGNKGKKLIIDENGRKYYE